MQITAINTFLEAHQLPTSYADTISRCFFPLVKNLVSHLDAAKKPLVVGVNGAQGSGKTTLGDFLVHALMHEFNLNVVSVSLDDFYLTKAQRTNLAQTIHPLFKTRGVPGTHDVKLAVETFERLLSGQPTRIPRFNKAIDDRFAEDDWQQVDKPVDVIVFEGWCLGAVAQKASDLVRPINKLERVEDEQLIWRRYINQQLLNHYPRLFDYVEQWVMLKAQSFDCVYNWRLEQESKLRARMADASDEEKKSVMSDEEVARFITFYQRITETLLDTLPAKVNYLFELDEHRRVIKDSKPLSGEQTKYSAQPLLIFSDMDGSLLNHHDYNFDAAKPLLRSLSQQQIPVIPCTSKTSAELFCLREELESETPFIVENGAAAYIPLGALLEQPQDTVERDGYWVKAFTQPRFHWLSLLLQVAEKYQGCYKSFNEMTLAEIMNATHLDERSAGLASKREYGEPVMWLADDEKKRTFVAELTSLGATVLQGGRFLHVSGETNKGQALCWLTEQYQSLSLTGERFKTIAIGDSQNDVAMLEVADIALLIPSPAHDLPALERDNDVFIAKQVAPEGWKQGVETILNELQDHQRR
jgi:D-glycerate 3-kinase